jgi:hypothetical protein
MFRLRLHKISDHQVRVTCAAFPTFQKVISMRGERRIDRNYRLYLGMKESMRDLLYARFGKQYRLKEIEHGKSLLRSTLSAVRRMK